MGKVDSPALPASSGVNLGLDHHGPAAEARGYVACRLCLLNNFSPGHIDPVMGENLLGLVFVNFH